MIIVMIYQRETILKKWRKVYFEERTEQDEAVLEVFTHARGDWDFLMSYLMNAYLMPA